MSEWDHRRTLVWSGYLAQINHTHHSRHGSRSSTKANPLFCSPLSAPASDGSDTTTPRRYAQTNIGESKKAFPNMEQRHLPTAKIRPNRFTPKPLHHVRYLQIDQDHCPGLSTPSAIQMGAFNLPPQPTSTLGSSRYISSSVHDTLCVLWGLWSWSPRATRHDEFVFMKVSSYDG